MEFDIIEETSKKELIEKLNKAAEEGWMPFRGMNTTVEDMSIIYTILIFKGT